MKQIEKTETEKVTNLSNCLSLLNQNSCLGLGIDTAFHYTAIAFYGNSSLVDSLFITFSTLF